MEGAPDYAGHDANVSRLRSKSSSEGKRSSSRSREAEAEAEAEAVTCVSELCHPVPLCCQKFCFLCSFVDFSEEHVTTMSRSIIPTTSLSCILDVSMACENASDNNKRKRPTNSGRKVCVGGRWEWPQEPTVRPSVRHKPLTFSMSMEGAGDYAGDGAKLYRIQSKSSSRSRSRSRSRSKSRSRGSAFEHRSKSNPGYI
jgi:hypothetical protein